MAHPENTSGLIRWVTELDPEGPDSSRITPVYLGQERRLITPNWLWSPRPIKGALGHLDFASGRITTKARRKVQDLAKGLGLTVDVDTVAGESVIYELRLRDDGTPYVQGAYAEFNLGDGLEHVLISGEPGRVLAEKPSVMSVVLGGCNGSNQATISTNPKGKRTAFQLGSHGADEKVDEYIVSAGFVKELSFYEENLARLATTLAGKVMVHSPDTRFTVVNDVPWRAYWLYLFRAMQQEKTSVVAYRRWRTEVTRRAGQGRKRYEDLLREILGDRSSQIEFIDRDELEPLHEILEGMRPGRHAPDFQALVDVMRNSGDPLWELVLDPEIRTKVRYRSEFLEPELRTVQELCGASYVVAVLRRLLYGPVMSVNDYVETTIEQFVQEFVKAISESGRLAFKGGSFAVYPFGHFVPRPDGGVMYRQDPGRIVTINDPIGDSGFRHMEWIDPVDLLKGSYLV